MTYNVFSGTLNPTQSVKQRRQPSTATIRVARRAYQI